VLQADNPDADSLGSALALESILGDQGKTVTLYCAVDMPSYLHYMSGWDRVSKDLPSSFEASIIVDASTMTLFEKFNDAHVKGIVASKPCVVLDHHAVTDHPIEFASVVLNDPSSASTGEVLYHLAHDNSWPVSVAAGEYIMSSILGDTQGLTNELTSPSTYRVMAELSELGVSRPTLEELRREYGKMPEVIFRYKAALIQRTELYAEGRIAVVSVPQQEINEYSPLYNPAPLVQNDMLQVQGVQVAIVLKRYDSGRITAAIRCNSGATIAGTLAEHFGGGGHHYASGFKITDGRNFDDIKAECISYAQTLLDTLIKEPSRETV
jgi:phosphoesterase RecJ-like protein